MFMHLSNLEHSNGKTLKQRICHLDQSNRDTGQLPQIGRDH